MFLYVSIGPQVTYNFTYHAANACEQLKLIRVQDLYLPRSFSFFRVMRGQTDREVDCDARKLWTDNCELAASGRRIEWKDTLPGAQRQSYRKASHEDDMLSKEGVAFGLCERNYDDGQTETRDDLSQRTQPVGRRMLSQSFVRT